MNQTPQLAIDGAIARITLARPGAANRLLPEDLPVLTAHVQAVNATVDRPDGVRVLVLQATGRHFCGGYEITEVARSQRPGAGFGDMVDAVEQCRAVTIAAIQGGVFGGATDMALACDFRVGGPAARMFMPAARLGLHYYQSGLERFVTRLGLDMAKRLFLGAEALDAEAMHRCGFLTHWAEGPDIAPAVNALAATLASMAPLALLGMKTSLNQIARQQADATALAAAVQRTVASDDLREAALAWQEKRPPVFSGR